nr:hypothetical protein [Tanacetum cinerariifolium]
MVLSESVVTIRRSRTACRSPLPWGAGYRTIRNRDKHYSQEYLLEFTSEYGIPKTLHPELPGPEDRIVDFPEGKTRVFPTVVDWRTNAPKDGMPTDNTYSIEAVRALDTHRTPIQKQSEMLLCIVEISRRYYMGDEVYPTFIHDDDRGGSCPRAPHEVPLLTLTANRVIEMDDPTAASDSSGVPSTTERSPLDFAHEVEASDQGTAAPEMPSSEDVPATIAPGAGQAEEVAAADPPAAAESRKRGRDGIDVNAPPKVLRRDHADPRPIGSVHGEKVLLPYNWVWRQLTLLPCLKMRPRASSQGTAAAGDPNSENASSPLAVGSLGKRYNVNLARQVAMGSQLRLRFEQEAKLLRKSVAQAARRDKRIQARELEIKNLEALLEAETNTKKVAKDKSVGLSQDLENMRAQFSDLQVSNERLSQQVVTLQQQVSREEKLKAAFEEFKRDQDDRVEQRCEEMEARLDALSIDFNEELYPHMLTAISGRRWVIGRGLRLAVMKCGESLELRQAFADVVSAGIAKGLSEGLSEGLRHVLEHGQAQLSLESIEAYDPGAEAKFVAALQALKDLKRYATSVPAPLSSPSLYTQSRAEKKKKCRIVCRTHGVGSAHHARSDGVPVSAPTVVP